MHAAGCRFPWGFPRASGAFGHAGDRGHEHDREGVRDVNLRKVIGTVFLSLLWLAGCATGDAPDGSGPVSTGATDAGSPLPGSSAETEQRRRARIRVELASNYYQSGNYRVALDELQQALAIDPGYATAFGLLGLIHADLGQQGRAEEAFRRGLRLAPDDADLNNSFGWFLCQSGRETASIAYFERAAKDPLYRTPAKPLHNAGICLLRAGDEEGAERFLHKAFEADPSNAVALYQLGELYLKRGDLQRARFYSQRLLAAWQPNAQTIWLALRIEHARGDADAERGLSAQLRRLFPDSPEAALLAQRRFGG